MKRETIRLQQKSLSKLINVMSVLGKNERNAGCLLLCGHHGYNSGKEFYLKDTPLFLFNLSTPNVNYSGRTAPLTSKVAFYIFIQQIYVLNILNMVYTLRFFLFKMRFVS